MKILIVKLAAIGDVLRTTFILPGLAEKYGGAPIDWLTAANAAEVFVNNPYIRKIYTWEERGELGSYDLLIGLEDDKLACELVSKVKAKSVIGAYLREGRQTYTPSSWFDMSVISQYGLEKANDLKKQNRKTFQQHMAELLGIKVSPYVFNLTPEEVEYGRGVVKELGVGSREKIVGINTGAGGRWPLKSWGVEQTIELVKRLKNELGLVSLILGGEQERARNALIAKETGMPDAGTHSLRHFAAIVNYCQLVLSSDSLAMHFAIALKKRLVVFFGPTSAAEIELYGLGQKLTAPLDCLTCYKKQCEIEPNCMDELPVGEMYQAVKKEISQS